MTWTDTVDETMSFVIPDSLLLHLESWVGSANGREVSGVGIIEKDPEARTFTLKKCWLMAAGSVAYTEIPGERMAKLIQEGVRPDQLKLWWHRHPVGNGIPGPHNWSGTDNNTIREEPFGIDPSMVQWLLAIVRTPRGWVARYDNHQAKTTIHMPVNGKISQEQYEAAANLIDRQVREETRASMARQTPVNKTSIPRKPGHKYAPPAKQATRDWDEPTPQPTKSNRLTSEAFRLAVIKTGWDRDTYEQVSQKLEYELPEFVAFDFAVTIAEMYTMGLLDDETVDAVATRIQSRVDQEDPQYINLIGQWDLLDL